VAHLFQLTPQPSPAGSKPRVLGHGQTRVVSES
jgi:hypothetical protein